MLGGKLGRERIGVVDVTKGDVVFSGDEAELADTPGGDAEGETAIVEHDIAQLETTKA